MTAEGPARHVTAPGHSPDELRRLIDEFAPGRLVIEAGPRDLPRTLILDAPDPAGLAAALAQGFDCYVEWAGPAVTAACLRDAVAPLVIALSTRSAFRCLTGAALSRTLVERGIIAPAVAAGVACATQEAIANAMLHGNLGLRLDPAADGASFARFHQAVAERLAAPESLRRWITVSISWTPAELTVRIADEGDGFAPPDHADSPDCAAAPSDVPISGRGLLVMRDAAKHLAFEAGGRCAALTFARAA